MNKETEQLKKRMIELIQEEFANYGISASRDCFKDIEKVFEKALNTQTTTLKKKVEGLRRKFVSQPAEYKGSDANVWRDGYNSALEDILKELNQ